jgi:hypothetical protein
MKNNIQRIVITAARWGLVLMGIVWLILSAMTVYRAASMHKFILALLLWVGGTLFFLGNKGNDSIQIILDNKKPMQVLHGLSLKG